MLTQSMLMQPELEEAQTEIAEVRLLTLHRKHSDPTTKRIKVV